MSIKNKLQYIIKKSLPVDMDVNKIVIEIPKDKKNGDYSTNVAFLPTKELKSSPINIANDIIKTRISSKKIPSYIFCSNTWSICYRCTSEF